MIKRNGFVYIFRAAAGTSAFATWLEVNCLLLIIEFWKLLGVIIVFLSFSKCGEISEGEMWLSYVYRAVRERDNTMFL